MTNEDRTIAEPDWDPIRAAWYSSGTIAEVIGGPQSFLAALAAQQMIRDSIDSTRVDTQGEPDQTTTSPEIEP